LDRSSVRAWVTAYERAWRAIGTEQVGELFTADATYRMAPFQEPHGGLEAIRALWDRERSGPDEAFDMHAEIIAVEDPRAVVRIEVRYGEPRPQHFRDLWVLEFEATGRCRSFEEWPFSAGHPVPHHQP
jgi:hypothetical protein